MVIGGVILIGIIGYASYRRNAGTAPAPQDGGDPAAAAGAEGGVPITAVSLNLSPEATIATERYRCVCSCNDALSVCTCTQTPGSIDMKQYVQELVQAGRTPAEMDAAMVARYGAAVLLTNPSAAGAAPGPQPPAGDR